MFKDAVRTHMKWEELTKKMEIEKEEMLSIIVALVGGVILLVFGRFYLDKFEGITLLKNIINTCALLLFIVPPFFVKYMKHRKIKEIERRFPDFMREIVEGLRGGMSLPLALKYAAKADYGAMNPLVKKLVSQISWGVPFEDAFREFMKETKSRVIGRAVSVIIEAHRSGGELARAIDSVTRATVEVEKIKDERRSLISSQRTQGYIIFFLFIGIMITIRYSLLPSLLGKGAASELMSAAYSQMSSSVQGNAISPINLREYDRMFLHLVIIQGFFSGLVIGKLAEGNFMDGLKHSLILCLMGYFSMIIASGYFAS